MNHLEQVAIGGTQTRTSVRKGSVSPRGGFRPIPGKRSSLTWMFFVQLADFVEKGCRVGHLEQPL